jgi:chromosome segregation ATPase
MSEQLKKLQATLDELEQELHSLESLDQHTRELLEEAAREIQTALDILDPHHLKPHSLTERLTHAARRFESTHPTLSTVVGRIIDLLGQMGI